MGQNGSTTFHLFERDIQIPNDLPYYIEICHRFSKQAQETINLLDTLVSNGKGAEGICKTIWEHTKSDINSCIAELSEYGVYNITASDYLSEDFYKQFLHIYNSQLDQMLSDADQYQAQALIDAELQTDAMVTGLPFTIYTSSPIGLAVYAVQEHSELKKQRRNANREYSAQARDINKAHRNMSSNAKSKAYSDFVSNMLKHIPFAYNFIKSNHIRELSRANKIDTHFLSQYSEKRSSDILDNFNVVQNKKAVIEESIVACPYNPNPFAKAGLSDLLEQSLVTLIKHIHIESEVIRRIESLDRLSKDNNSLPSAIYAKHTKAFKVISLLSNESESDVAKKYYQNAKDTVITPFKKLHESIKKIGTTQSYNDFIQQYKDSIQRYAQTNDPSLFIQDCVRCQESEIDVLITRFGETRLIQEIASSVGYPSIKDDLQLNDILDYLRELLSPILSIASEKLVQQQQNEAEQEKIKIQEELEREKRNKETQKALLMLDELRKWSFILSCVFIAVAIIFELDVAPLAITALIVAVIDIVWFVFDVFL